MHRRTFLLAPLAALLPPAHAHHGWSSFDTERVIYLEGKVAKIAWRNPHAELDLDLAPDLKLPADLAQRALPAQSAQVDGPRLLRSAQLPTRKDRRWHVELAPLTRMEAWQVQAPRVGDSIAMLGYTFAGEKGDPVLRVEYLFIGGKAYGLRSSPA